MLRVLSLDGDWCHNGSSLVSWCTVSVVDDGPINTLQVSGRVDLTFLEIWVGSFLDLCQVMYDNNFPQNRYIYFAYLVINVCSMV